MIKMTKVSIANFRSFKEVKFSENLCDLKDSNIITGKNNAGKTNVLRAIHLFFNPSNYNPYTDQNYIKKITYGASRAPVITITFKDAALIKDKTVTYSIKCDLNKEPKKMYSCQSSDSTFNNSIASWKFKKDYEYSSNHIKKYLDNNFKCVYIATTDDVISAQASSALNDMILEYYKKRNKEVKESIEKFMTAHKNLLDTFQNNITSLEVEMAKEFDYLKSDGLNILPKLTLNDNLAITDFLVENLELKLDDTYIQDIGSKGAGIQRSSLILLNLFLLKNIYARKNKIILLDEPEAYLYPLLVKKIKNSLDMSLEEKGFQMFLTTHSPIFLENINSEENYKYYNIEQNSEVKSYERSRNEEDTNKYSIIHQYDRKTKNQILRNYGLMESLADYEDVIVVEGETDKNYIEEILKDSPIVPQIKYGNLFNYNFIGSGASAIYNILSYLNDVSPVKRNVFVLLDGDKEGKELGRKIPNEKLPNLKIEVKVLPDKKVVEDVAYSIENLAKKLYQIEEFSSKFNNVNELKEILSNNPYDNIVDFLQHYTKTNGINYHIERIKVFLSQNLSSVPIETDWIKEELEEFFNLNEV